MRLLALTFASSLLAACAKPVSQQTAYMKGVTAPAPTPAFATYAASEAFGPHPVALTAPQRAWLLRVVHSRTYGAQRSKMRFAVMPGSKTPLIVFIANYRPDTEDPVVHVIGGSCNEFFRPTEGYRFFGTDAGCADDPPPPVIP